MRRYQSAPIVEKEIIFTGKRREKLTRLCACGCGLQFSTTFPRQKYVSEAHKKRHAREMSRNV